MYHIATLEDFALLRQSYTHSHDYCRDVMGFHIPYFTEEQMLELTKNGNILVSDLETDYCANLGFAVNDDYVEILWSCPDLRHAGSVDAMGSYLVFTYKKPLRYWLIANSDYEGEVVSNGDYRLDNHTLLDERVDEHGQLLRFYEFTAPELAWFRGGDES